MPLDISHTGRPPSPAGRARVVRHALAATAPGTAQELVSLHYGAPGRGPRAVIQAALHADELPGMLVVQHLRQALDRFDAQGRVAGEVVLVPVANPVGLAQRVLHGALGRFDLASGENFNRHFPDLRDSAARAAQPHLRVEDAGHNVTALRKALRDAVAALDALTPAQSLRRTLLGLACDADIVLDLHCDAEAVLHMYAGTPLWPQAEPLARYLGAELVLLARRSGDAPFDEACSAPWWELGEQWAARYELPPACLAATVELRGAADVDPVLAERDAQAIVHFLAFRGVLAIEAPEPPPLVRAPLPLAGSWPVVAPSAGLLVFSKAPGDVVRRGEPVVELIDPIGGGTMALASPTDGLLYAREHTRFAVPGMRVAKVAGSEAMRCGALLGP